MTPFASNDYPSRPTARHGASAARGPRAATWHLCYGCRQLVSAAHQCQCRHDDPSQLPGMTLALLIGVSLITLGVIAVAVAVGAGAWLASWL